MKRVLLFALVLCASAACGCQSVDNCSNGNGSALNGGGASGGAAYGGPSAPQVTYPYYTTRGPRDFFVDQPQSVGR